MDRPLTNGGPQEQTALAGALRNVRIIKLGCIDTLSIVEPAGQELFVISAGVERHITFEKDLLKHWDVEMLLLDPSPAGVETMNQCGSLNGATYLEAALGAEDSMVTFSQPVHSEEGSFYMAIEVSKDAMELVEFECVSL